MYINTYTHIYTHTHIQQRFPVIDFTPPSLEIIEAASAYVNKVVQEGVYCIRILQFVKTNPCICIVEFVKRNPIIHTLHMHRRVRQKKPHYTHTAYASYSSSKQTPMPVGPVTIFRR